MLNEALAFSPKLLSAKVQTQRNATALPSSLTNNDQVARFKLRQAVYLWCHLGKNSIITLGGTKSLICKSQLSLKSFLSSPELSLK